MSRFVCGVFAVLSLFLTISTLTGCGGGSSNGGTPTPVAVTLSPTASPQSVEIGSLLQFTATALNTSRQAITIPVEYLSSDSSVITFVPNAPGLACAGRWDALGQVCTPGSAGVTQVSAVANGVSSPTITVFVHDHVARIVVEEFSPTTPPPPQVPCVTSAKVNGVQNFLDFRARAFSQDGADITNTVGSFTFQQVSGAVVTLDTTASELNNNNGTQVTQVRATAGQPGITQIFATAAGVNSAPTPFETCLVKSIQMQVGSATTNTSFSVAKGTSAVVSATVLDRLGNQLDKAPLTWASLSPGNATVSSSGDVTTTNVGGTAITASCIPPSCNIGSANGQPPTEHPVYPSNVITGTITGTAGTGTVYVTSTCTVNGAPVPGCQPAILPITTKDNLIGNRFILPSAPNTFVFDPQGKKAYLGSSQGLIVFTPGGAAGSNPIAQFNSAPGKLLAVSNDGNKALVGDTTSHPNQVYLVDTSGTSTGIASLLIPGAVAAAFSPDDFKAFIVSNTPNVGTCTTAPNNQAALYVFSPFEALKTICLSAPANAISFFANAGFAYLNGGAPNALTAYNTCDNSVAEATIPVPQIPALFQATLDGVHAIGISSPGVDIFSTTLPPGSTCPYSVTTTNTFVNLGQGDFTPIQLIVTSDSSKAYILTSNLGSVFIYNFGVNTVDAIPLAGNTAPLGASLSADGSQLYVGAADGDIHAISTATGVDLQQITLPPNNGTNSNSLCTNIPGTCPPDLIAFQP
jgi:hypothetical protein